MKKFAFAVIALIAFALILGTTAISTSQAMAASAYGCRDNSINAGITVTGAGIVRVKPDIAVINLSIETKNKSLESAKSENTAIAQNLVNILKKQNITEQDISTSWFNIYPEYDYNNGQRFLGHRVSNQLSVKVRDITTVGKIIDLATAAGANTVSGVQFGIEDNSGAYNEALIKAVASAKQKAAVLSSATDLDDMKIISVKEISMSNIGYGRHNYAMSEGAGYTSIMSSDIEVSAIVEIVFAL